MRLSRVVLAAGLVLGTLAAESSAQYFSTQSYVTPYVVNPYVVNPYVSPYGVSPYVTPYVAPAPAYTYGAYVSPYGYRSAYSYGVSPAPWGYNTYYNSSTYVRPLFTGPYHAPYFDPFANTYRFGPGYLNTPRYVFRYGY